MVKIAMPLVFGVMGLFNIPRIDGVQSLRAIDVAGLVVTGVCLGVALTRGLHSISRDN